MDEAYAYKAVGKTCDLLRAEKMHITLGKSGFHELPEDA